jgi:hypothetical protein
MELPSIVRETSSISAETHAFFSSRSSEQLRTIEEVSSKISKLAPVNVHAAVIHEAASSLNSDETTEFERFQISPEGKIVVRRLDVRWKSVFILCDSWRLGGIGGHRRQRLEVEWQRGRGHC